MSTETSCVSLRGVKADIVRTDRLNESKYLKEIKRIGEKIGCKLTRLLETVESTGEFVLWDFEESDHYGYEHADEDDWVGLSLEAGTFYIDKIIFFKDEEYGYFSLAILGATNMQSELWDGWGSELQVAFKKRKNNLVFSDAVFIGQEDHRFESVVEFGISDKSKLEILHIADRATDVFLRMNLLSEKPQI